MTAPGDRRKKKKFVRLPGGKTKKISIEKRGSKKKCAICGREISGTLSSKKEKKASKSMKKASAPLSGALCNSCRATVFEEALKVKEGVKKPESIEIRLKPFVETAAGKIER